MNDWNWEPATAAKNKRHEVLVRWSIPGTAESVNRDFASHDEDGIWRYCSRDLDAVESFACHIIAYRSDAPTEADLRAMKAVPVESVTIASTVAA